MTVLEELRPMLWADGGDMELIDVSLEGVVQIRFVNVCADCSDSMISLREGIERLLKERIPGVIRVVAL